MDEKYNVIKRETLIQFKRKVPFDLGAKGEEIYLTGDEAVSKQMTQVKKQKNLVDYVEKVFAQASYYNGNLKSLVDSQDKVNRFGN